MPSTGRETGCLPLLALAPIPALAAVLLAADDSALIIGSTPSPDFALTVPEPCCSALRAVVDRISAYASQYLQAPDGGDSWCAG